MRSLGLNAFFLKGKLNFEVLRIEECKSGGWILGGVIAMNSPRTLFPCLLLILGWGQGLSSSAPCPSALGAQGRVPDREGSDARHISAPAMQNTPSHSTTCTDLGRQRGKNIEEKGRERCCLPAAGQGRRPASVRPTHPQNRALLIQPQRLKAHYSGKGQQNLLCKGSYTRLMQSHQHKTLLHQATTSPAKGPPLLTWSQHPLL